MSVGLKGRDERGEVRGCHELLKCDSHPRPHLASEIWRLSCMLPNALADERIDILAEDLSQLALRQEMRIHD